MELLENAYIYCFKDKDKIIYIGKSHQPIENRLEQHITRCHNDKLKEYLKSKEPPVFEIIYESHNQITEEVLCSFEQSWIETLKPECNKEGVLFPYGGYKPPKRENKQLGLAEVMAKKKSYSDYEIDELFKNNPFIKECRYILMEDAIEERKQHYKKDKIPSDATIRKEINNKLELEFGKLNNFNEKQCFNETTGNFQQKAWFVRNKETKKLRFPTQEEKLYGFKKDSNEQLRQGRIFFYNKTIEEVCHTMSYIIQKQSEYRNTMSKEEFLNYYIWSTSVICSIGEMLKMDNPQYLYFPLKPVSISGQDNTRNIYYIDTLMEWCNKRSESK